jgi:hypothetical protein
MQTVWSRGENLATCGQPGCGHPPSAHDDTSGCGFNAFAHLRSLRRYLDVQRMEQERSARPIPWCGQEGPSVLCGVMAGWGTVQLATLGWRSTHAEIVALFGTSAMAERMANRYQVTLLPLPVDVEKTERLLGGEWGLSYDDALRLPADFEVTD